ncbi:hypothetical protein QFZ91_005963 [Paraburkholderia sp. JPY419]
MGATEFNMGGPFRFCDGHLISVHRTLEKARYHPCRSGIVQSRSEICRRGKESNFPPRRNSAQVTSTGPL